MAVLSNEENIVKLENLIKKGEHRLVELANQWNEVQAPLLEELEALNRLKRHHWLSCTSIQIPILFVVLKVGLLNYRP